MLTYKQQQKIKGSTFTLNISIAVWITDDLYWYQTLIMDSIMNEYNE